MNLRPALFIFLLGLAPLSRAQTVLPLENAGFEKGLAGWKLDPASAAPSVQVTPASAALGANGVRIEPTAKAATLSSTPVPVQAGHVYRVSFWARGSDSRTQIRMVFLGADGSEMQAVPSKGFRATVAPWLKGRFEQYWVQAPAPAAAATLAVRISMPGKAPLDLDDFVLQDVPENASVYNADESPDLLLADLKAHPRTAKMPAKIILKFDDVIASSATNPAWRRLVDFIGQRGIKANLGIICNSLEADNPGYIQWLRSVSATGLVEFWNHGYDHRMWKENGKTLMEFAGTPYEFQKEHFTKANRLAKEKAGITFAAFGAPFNAIDGVTAKVLAEDPATKFVFWIEKDRTPPGKLSIQRVANANLESPVFNPNYNRFLEGYVHNRNLNYFLLQGHPGSWTGPRFEQFTKIIDFLTAQGAVFVKTSELSAADTILGSSQ